MILVNLHLIWSISYLKERSIMNRKERRNKRELEKLLRENEKLLSEIAKIEGEIEQMRQNLGYWPRDNSVKLLKKGGEIFGTIKDFSQKWGMPEKDVIESMQSLADKGAMNVRIASETKEGEKVYATSLTRLA